MVFTEHGDAWVGVTHNPQAIEALKTFSARRYGQMSRNYASKVRQSVDRLLKERWITHHQ